MPNDEQTGKKSIREKVEELISSAPSKEAQYEELALDTLAALLKSEDEKIRLQAAQTILNRPRAPKGEDPGAGLIGKLKKARK